MTKEAKKEDRKIRPVICEVEDCKKEFMCELDIKQISKGMYQVFFKCPHCKHEYNVHLESQYTLDLLKQAHIIMAKLETAKFKPECDILLKNLNETTKKRKKIFDKLNK